MYKAISLLDKHTSKRSGNSSVRRQAQQATSDSYHCRTDTLSSTAIVTRPTAEGI